MAAVDVGGGRGAGGGGREAAWSRQETPQSEIRADAKWYFINKTNYGSPTTMLILFMRNEIYELFHK